MHSVLSPLSASSPIHPDGVVTPLWNEKHFQLIPAVFVAFFAISSDRGRDSLDDNKAKGLIVDLKSSLETSKYRTRLVVIFVGEEDASSNNSKIEDRVNIIARVTKLNTKNEVFYIPANTSGAEIKTFVHAVLSILQTASSEYYRELSRHARRRRERNTSSSILSARPGGTVPRKAWITR